HAAKDILKQLGCFSNAARRHRNQCVNGFAIDFHRALEAGLGITAHNLRDRVDFALTVPWVLAFRRESQVKVDASAHAALRRVESRGLREEFSSRITRRSSSVVPG